MRLFAFLTLNPELRRATCAALKRAGTFSALHTPPGSKWLVAFTPDSPESDRSGAYFLEGASELAAVSTAELLNRCRYGQLQPLPGDFTFACFGAQAEAFFVRSAAGAAPLFLWQNESSVAVASRLGDLLRFIPEEPRLDLLGNAVLCGFAAAPPDGRTPFEGVRLLENGAVTAVSGTLRCRTAAWWCPPVAERPRPGRVREHADELHRLLVASLRAGTSSDGASLFAVSGGLDSSTLAWLASATLGRRFSTLTLVPERPANVATMRAQTQALFTELGTAVTRRFEFATAPEARLDYLAQTHPEAAYVGHPALCLLERVSREHPVRFYVGGEFCDQVLGGGPVAQDFAFSSSAFDLLFRRPHYLRGARGIRSVVTTRVRRMLGRALTYMSSQPPPSFLSREATLEYVEAARDEAENLARDRRPRAALAYQIRLAQPTLVQNWEVSSRLGIRRVFPFFNRAALDLAYRTHPLDMADVRNKSLLLAAMRPTIPPALLDRPKYAWREGAANLPWTDRIPAELGGIVRADWLESPPQQLSPLDALRLRATLNIITAVRTIRLARRESTR